MDAQSDLIIELLNDIRDRLTTIEVANDAVVKLEQKREQTRLRVKKYRENSKGDSVRERVSEDGPATAIVDIHKPPRLEDLMAWAHSQGYTDDAYTREWFDTMNKFGWCHHSTGNPIRNWAAYYFQFERNHKADLKKLAEKDRVRIGTVKHGANWRGTRKEKIGNVI